MTFQDQEIPLLEFPISRFSRDSKFLNQFCAHLVKNCGKRNLTFLINVSFTFFFYSVAVELSFQTIQKKKIYIFLAITPNPGLYNMYSHTYDASMHHMRLCMGPWHSWSVLCLYSSHQQAQTWNHWGTNERMIVIILAPH